MRIEITSQQKVKKVNLKETRATINKIFRLLNIPSAKISVFFCDNSFIWGLNKKFLHHSDSTDVIAFNLEDSSNPDYLGEIVVSVEQAAACAANYGNTWEEEVAVYLVHGILHLLGYDDETPTQRRVLERRQAYIIGALFPHKL